MKTQYKVKNYKNNNKNEEKMQLGDKRIELSCKTPEVAGSLARRPQATPLKQRPERATPGRSGSGLALT